ncbi:MAG: hypothetical protein Q7U66_04075 [Methylobacter sp.]|nr:hypothetical protein [Methylobacter sp.]
MTISSKTSQTQPQMLFQAFMKKLSFLRDFPEIGYLHPNMALN